MILSSRTANATIDKNIKLVNAGLRSKLSAIMEINKCSEAEAKKELERIAEEGQITGQDIDWTEGDDDESEQKDVPAEETKKEKGSETDDNQDTERRYSRR